MLRRPLERLEDPARLAHERLVCGQLGIAREDPADVKRERVAFLLVDFRVDDLDWAVSASAPACCAHLEIR